MRCYIWGDGAIWRVPHRVIRAARVPADLLEGAKLLGAAYDYGKGEWPQSQLPKGIWASSDGRLQMSSGVSLVHYDRLDDALADWKRQIRRTT